MTSSPEYRLAVPKWDEQGEDEDPKARLLTTVVLVDQFGVGGVHLHLEAVQVHVVGDLQVPVEASGYSEEALTNLHLAVDADGHWDTLEVDGREYVVFATPFC